MDIFGFDYQLLMSFLLTLIRVSIVVFLMPFFGGETTPNTIKACACIVFTLAIWPQLSLPATSLPSHPFAIAVIILGEVIMGMVLGLCVHFIFAGIQVGGEILAFQMGFTMVSIADPMTNATTSVTAQLLYMVTIVIFLIFDGHLHILRALADSFVLIPAGGLTFNNQVVSNVIELSSNMFVLGLKIAAPVMAALFMVELTLALMGRAAPQMNLMTMGFPLKISIGFFFLSLLLKILSGRMYDLILELAPMFRHIMLIGR